ncbi:tetratricopeptide repeat protein [Cohnella boryungensis]|uniref:Tetratricopeptide repeat protein n=1 Tax=Cohnella boryungensis TaxID=768479 RepID=A0ABV8SGE3_9BACL
MNYEQNKISRARTVYLEQALNQIQQVCDDYKARNLLSPFFFLVGAGISYPSAPLAKEIVDHCKAQARELGRSESISNGNNLPQEQYSKWFELAYPSRYQRQNYLKQLLHNKPISAANIKLAHLLAQKVVSNLVLTLNFDDFLSRALNIFSIDHIVADHPHTVEKINNENNDIKIVHIHGTYWFYDCCNLNGEIVQRAERSLSSNQTMSFFVDSILYRHSPLVIGYSGWENDVFMESLKRRLQSPLPCNLYWFCYETSNINDLPDWLVNHQDVIFVIPQEDQIQTVSKEDNLFELNKNDHTISIDTKSKSKVDELTCYLDAQTVFEKFIEKFNIESPEIIRDPINFFLNLLDLSGKGTNEEEENNYFKHAILRLKNASNSKEYNVNSKIAELQELLRKSKYSTALNYAFEIYNNEDIADSEKIDLMDMVLVAMEKLKKNEKGYEIIRWTTRILLDKTMGEEKIKSLNSYFAKAALNFGKSLIAQKMYQESIEKLDEVIECCNNCNESNFTKLFVDAFYLKAICYKELNNKNESIKILDETIQKYYHDQNKDISEKVLESMHLKGVILRENDQPVEAIKLFEQIKERYDVSKIDYFREYAAAALHSKGITYAAHLKLFEQANEAFAEIIRGYNEQKGLYGSAHLNYAQSLREAGNNEEAINLLNTFLNENQNNHDSEIQKFVIRAHLKKASIYESQKQYLDALNEYNYLTEKNDEEVIGRVTYINVVYRKGRNLFAIQRYDEALASFNSIIQEHETTSNSKILEIVASAMHLKGHVLVETIQFEEAIDMFKHIQNKFKHNPADFTNKVIIKSLIGEALAHQKNLNHSDAVKVLLGINLEEADKHELKLKIIEDLHGLAFNMYNNMNYESSASLFFYIFNQGFEAAGINVSYLIRKYLKNNNGYPDHEVLLRPALEKKDPFALVNNAMLYIRTNSWDSAYQCISLISEFEKVVQWWYDLAKKDDSEGELVLGMILKYKPDADPDGLTEHQRLALAMKGGIEIPQSILQTTSRM